MIRKGFTLEGIDKVFYGYTDGSNWNGFENPQFDEQTSANVAAELRAYRHEGGDHYEITHDVENHQYLIYWIENRSKPEEPDIIPSMETEYGRLYSWGWGWCWYPAK